MAMNMMSRSAISIPVVNSNLSGVLGFPLLVYSVCSLVSAVFPEKSSAYMLYSSSISFSGISSSPVQ